MNKTGLADLSSLVGKIRGLFQKQKTEQEQKNLRGEGFNVFDILGIKNHDETRLHSAFLVELLNPNGSHGLSSKFLEAFIETTIGNEFNFDMNGCEVKCEVYIGNRNKNNTEGGRLDILIKNNKNQAIIIENKIYAGDGDKQLIRYDNYGKNKYPENFKLLYLTLDGKDASVDSCGKDKSRVEYQRISYKIHILDWLKRCQALACNHPLVRETIAQYILLIKKLTYQEMDTEQIKKSLHITDYKSLYELIQGVNHISQQLEKIEYEMLFSEIEKVLNDYKSQKETNCTLELIQKYNTRDYSITLRISKGDNSINIVYHNNKFTYLYIPLVTNTVEEIIKKSTLEEFFQQAKDKSDKPGDWKENTDEKRFKICWIEPNPKTITDVIKDMADRLIEVF